MRLAILGLVAACAPAWKATPHDQLFQIDPPTTLIKRPVETDPSDWWDKGALLLVRPLGRLLSPGTYAKALLGGPPARDVNRLGQVPDSPWFENGSGATAIRRSRRAKVQRTIGASLPVRSR